MDMDDELRRAGDALDTASRRHRQGTWPSGDGRAAWMVIAAGLLVVGLVIGALFAYGRGRDDSDAVIVPGTGSSAETTAVITTPETDPSTTIEPVADTGYRCLTSEPVDAGGLVFTIERFPECSATSLVMLRVGGTTSVTCTGPLDAHLSDGTMLAYSYSSKYWDSNGAWTPQDASGATTTLPEELPFRTMQYFVEPAIVRPIVLPADASGSLVFTISIDCPGSPPAIVDIPFTLTPATRTDVQIVRVDENANYYGACGNEVAQFTGETWYPLLRAEADLIDPALYPLPAPPSSGVRAPKVAPPGPGDDVGTFVVYSDGVGRYESDSGRVKWLTRQPHQYNWEC